MFEYLDNLLKRLMTPRALPPEPSFYVWDWSRQLFYGPNATGHAVYRANAGQYSLSEALDICRTDPTAAMVPVMP